MLDEIKTPSLKNAISNSEVSNLVTKVEEGKTKYANKAMKFHKGAMKGLGIVSGIIAVGAIGGMVLDSQNKSNTNRMKNAAKRSSEKEAKEAKDPNGKKEAYYDMMQFKDFVQNLSNGRSNSSKAYGGRRY